MCENNYLLIIFYHINSIYFSTWVINSKLQLLKKSNKNSATFKIFLQQSLYLITPDMFTKLNRIASCKTLNCLCNTQFLLFNMLKIQTYYSPLISL